MKLPLKLLLIGLFILLSEVSIAQDKLLAFLWQDGNLTFRITLADFYYQISQSGKITEFGTVKSGSISYNLSNRIDKIGDTNVSYNISDKVDKIDPSNISYNAYGKVDRIDDSAGLIVYRSKTTTVDDLIKQHFMNLLQAIQTVSVFE